MSTSNTVDNRLSNNKFDGVGNPNQGEQTDMALTLEPNKFPQDKINVSLSDEEVVLS